MKPLKNTYAVIMAGGVGERFWPLSRKSNPKQFLDVFTGEPMLITTTRRVAPIIPSSRVVLVTNKAYEARSRKILKKLPGVKVIGEPVGKNTAPAIAAAAALIERENPDAVMAVLSADHIITPEKAFLESLDLAVRTAVQNNTLVCLGVKPLHPHTGLGYIETGKKITSSGKIKASHVIRFVEKPNLESAKSFTKSGKHLWNCGIFVWSVATILNAFKLNMPKLYALLAPVRKASPKGLVKALDTFYRKAEKESIDYGVLEKSDSIIAVECPISWNDVGSWSAFKSLLKADSNGNVFKGEHIDLDSRDSFVLSDSGIVASYGLSGIFAVKHGDMLLLIHKDKMGDMKKLIEKMKDSPAASRYLL